MKELVIMLALIVLAGCSSNEGSWNREDISNGSVIAENTKYQAAKNDARRYSLMYSNIYKKISGELSSAEMSSKYEYLLYDSSIKIAGSNASESKIAYIMNKMFNYSVISLAMGSNYVDEYLKEDAYDLHMFIVDFYSEQNLSPAPSVDLIEYEMALSTANFIKKLGTHDEVIKNGDVYVIYKYKDSSYNVKTCEILKQKAKPTKQGKGHTIRDCIVADVLSKFTPSI